MLIALVPSIQRLSNAQPTQLPSEQSPSLYPTAEGLHPQLVNLHRQTREFP